MCEKCGNRDTEVCELCGGRPVVATPVLPGAAFAPREWKAPFELVAGDRVKIKGVRGVVITAAWWNPEGWYIEFRDENNTYRYYKQGSDGGDVEKLAPVWQPTMCGLKVMLGEANFNLLYAFFVDAIEEIHGEDEPVLPAMLLMKKAMETII